ncbi:MAG: hypothetical protein DHS80DRAFT_31333 [Piptocephalis tieghemiana]|nr:MAG: hypothetical protein DHS80DRAFT_31333 [Piptocephalis tieghemiana]
MYINPTLKDRRQDLPTSIRRTTMASSSTTPSVNPYPPAQVSSSSSSSPSSAPKPRSNPPAVASVEANLAHPREQGSSGKDGLSPGISKPPAPVVRTKPHTYHITLDPEATTVISLKKLKRGKIRKAIKVTSVSLDDHHPDEEIANDVTKVNEIRGNRDQEDIIMQPREEVTEQEVQDKDEPMVGGEEEEEEEEEEGGDEEDLEEGDDDEEEEEEDEDEEEEEEEDEEEEDMKKEGLDEENAFWGRLITNAKHYGLSEEGEENAEEDEDGSEVGEDDDDDDDEEEEEEGVNGDEYDMDDAFIDDSEAHATSMEAIWPQHDAFYIWRGPLETVDVTPEIKKSTTKKPTSSSTTTTTPSSTTVTTSLDSSSTSATIRKSQGAPEESGVKDKAKRIKLSSTDKAPPGSTQTTPTDSAPPALVTTSLARPSSSKVSLPKPPSAKASSTGDSLGEASGDPQSMAPKEVSSGRLSPSASSSSPSSSPSLSQPTRKGAPVIGVEVPLPSTVPTHSDHPVQPLPLPLVPLMDKLKKLESTIDKKDPESNRLSAELRTPLQELALEIARINGPQRKVDEDIFSHLFAAFPSAPKHGLRAYVRKYMLPEQIKVIQQEMQRIKDLLRASIRITMKDMTRRYAEEVKAAEEAKAKSGIPMPDLTKKYKWVRQEKLYVIDLFTLCEEETALKNDMAILEKKIPQFVEKDARRALTQEILQYWPEGWMQQSKLTADVGALRRKLILQSSPSATSDASHPSSKPPFKSGPNGSSSSLDLSRSEGTTSRDHPPKSQTSPSSPSSRKEGQSNLSRSKTLPFSREDSNTQEVPPGSPAQPLTSSARFKDQQSSSAFPSSPPSDHHLPSTIPQTSSSPSSSSHSMSVHSMLNPESHRQEQYVEETDDVIILDAPPYPYPTATTSSSSSPSSSVLWTQ